MKKYLFLLLALFGLSFSNAQVYESYKFMGDDNVIKSIPPIAKIKLRGNEMAFKYQGQVVYYNYKTKYTSKSGKVYDVYEGKPGYEILFDPVNIIIATSEGVMKFRPTSYFLEMGDKGDSDEEDIDGPTLPYGYTLKIRSLDNGQKVLFADGPNGEMVMVSYVVGNTGNYLKSYEYESNEISSTREFPSKTFSSGIRSDSIGTIGKDGGIELTTVYTYPNGTKVLVNTYEPNPKDNDFRAVDTGIILKTYLISNIPNLLN